VTTPTCRLVAGIGLALTIGGSALAAQPAAPPEDFKLPDGSNALDYLVQAVCLGADGLPNSHLPIDPDCVHSRPMTENDPVLWRKHDWGNFDGPAGGWLASDAVLARRGDIWFVDQTFDFGAPSPDNAGHSDAYFRFDQNDGGDAIRIVGDTASAFLTQDGGEPGLQWFIGPGCAQPGPQRYVSWVLFKADIDTAWRSVVAELGDGPQDTCPPRFNHAFTRYRLVTESFPFQRPTQSGGSVRQTATLSTILVEHYDARSIDRAHALERFYYARRLGKLRWEAWSRKPDLAPQADAFARSGRCAELPDGTPPDAAWRMIDCRMWTNIVRSTQANWRVRDFGWPPADLTLQ